VHIVPRTWVHHTPSDILPPLAVVLDFRQNTTAKYTELDL